MKTRPPLWNGQRLCYNGKTFARSYAEIPPAPNPMPHHPTTELVLDLFRSKGDSGYGGEPVTLARHALQAAALAQRDGAGPPLIVAALLHDIGLMLHDPSEFDAELGLDEPHEEIAAGWLSGRFPDDVVAPVALHVEAKRYLCAVEPDYLGILSIPALTGLALQGGPMSPGEIRDFRTNPHFETAVQLRRWDDQARDPDAEPPPIEHFAPMIDRVLDR